MNLLRCLQGLTRAGRVGVALLALGLGSAQAGVKVERLVLPNGVPVLWVQTPGLPMVDIQVDFDAGARRDPKGKEGLANATADLMERGLKARGDAPALDENQVGEAWADLGASFNLGAGADRFSLTLRSLTRPTVLDAAIRLAARHLGDASLDPDLWARDRARSLASLKESLTRPGTQVERAYARAVFGDHHYGREVTEASLQAITVADMAEFIQTHLRACRARVSVVGALDREQVRERVTQLLAQLPTDAQCAPLPSLPPVQALREAQNLRITLATAQSHVRLGQPGIARNDPDFFTLTVGNYVLGGGGFVSRLTEQVREKRGLSYSVYSYFAPGLQPGAFTIGLQTRPDQAEQAVQVARDVLSTFVREGPSERELRAAKDNLVGGFALRLDSNRKLLDNLANMHWNDLPLDYLETWTRQVEAVTTAQIRQAFGRVIQPDRLVQVIVGP